VTALLEITALEAGYGDVRVLHGVSLEADGDQIVSIIGPNGAGKSTLLKAVYGLLEPSAGAVHFAGDEITGLRPDRLTRRGMNLVPQLDNVFPNMTVTENLQVSALPLPRQRRRAAIDGLLERFPLLSERRRQRGGSLSGGQRKLLALARALVTEPRLLLLDEPSAGLAPQAVELVFATLGEVRARGVTVVMVEQNARRCLQICDRGYVMDSGRNAYTGTGEELATDPKVIELYLGTLAKA